MKRRILSILLILALAFSLAGCGDNNLREIEIVIEFHSYEELAQAKTEAAKNGYKVDTSVLKDGYKASTNVLKGLEHYYVPVYAENNLDLHHGEVYSMHISIGYNVSGKTYWPNDFLLVVSRKEDGEKRWASTINPSRPRDNMPKPWIIEGVYYVEYVEPINPAGALKTVFYFVKDNHFCSLKISTHLLKQIEEKDPEALKGPLFELRKVELK